MSNIEKYNNVFIKIFNLTLEQLKGINYHEISEWDSVGHMELITAIEDTFHLMLQTEDIIDFTSYQKGKKILSKEDYGVDFDE